MGGDLEVTDVDVIIPLHRPDRPIAATIESVASELQGVLTRAIVVLHDLELAGDTLEQLQRVAMVISHRDGIPSPSGPRNAGLDSATARYVFFLDSDDALAPGCLGALCRVAEASGADVVLPSVRDGDRYVGTPLALRRSTSTLDVVRHHLFMRSHVPALIRRATLLDSGIRYPAGIRTGQDFVMMAQLYATASTAIALDAVYIMADDGRQRVSRTPLPAEHQLAAVHAILTSPWAQALPTSQREALVHRILSINLAGGWRRKRQMGHPLPTESHAKMRALALSLAPGAADYLSVRDRMTLRFDDDPGPWHRILTARPLGLIPTTLRGASSLRGPLGIELRSLIVRRRRRVSPPFSTRPGSPDQLRRRRRQPDRDRTIRGR